MELDKYFEKPEQGDEEAVRCVCGCSGEGAAHGFSMISCEGCKVWQHFKCTGMPWDPEQLHYPCERCQPPDPKKLLGEEKRKRGERRRERGEEPWEWEESEEVRCVCGLVGDDAEDGRNMLCCERCEVWQHLECMDIPENPMLEQYFCERCKPANHTKLLGEIKRGEKPWEDRRRERERAEMEMNPKKARGKRGKKGKAENYDFLALSRRGINITLSYEKSLIIC